MPITPKTHEFLVTRDSPRACLHHKLHGPEHGHSERPDRTGVPENRDCHHFYRVESGSGLNIYLMIPLSSFRLYPSARLSLSETCVKYLCCHLFVCFCCPTNSCIISDSHVFTKMAVYWTFCLFLHLWIWVSVEQSLFSCLCVYKCFATKYVFEPKPISFCCRKW